MSGEGQEGTAPTLPPLAGLYREAMQGVGAASGPNPTEAVHSRLDDASQRNPDAKR